MKKTSSFLMICILLCVNIASAAKDNSYYVLKEENWTNYRWFSEGLCAVLDNDTQRWGFVDKKGEWVILPQFKDAYVFNDGLCNVTTVDNEKVFIDRNGKIVHLAEDNGASSKYVKLLNGCGYITAWNYHMGFLIDSNYNDIVRARPIDKDQYTFFQTEDEKIYNSKGIEITNKLNTDSPYSCRTNNKYIVYSSEHKVYVHNIDGKLISEFPYNKINGYGYGNITLFSEAIRISGDENLYGIDGKVLLTTKDKIEEYYNKYYVISKNNGTSALYKKNGSIIVDFGKWDAIIPSSISDKMLVKVNQNYGIADFNNNIIVPLSGIRGEVINNGKIAVIDISDYKRIAYDFYSLNSQTLTRSTASATTFDYSGRMVAQLFDDGNNWKIFDENLNIIATTKLPYSINGANEGIYLFDGEDGFYEPNEYVIFNDCGGIKVSLDRNTLAFDVPPVISDGRTMVPMRTIFEALGANVEWNGETQTIIAKNKDITIQMQIDNNVLIKNGQKLEMDVCPQLVDGRTMVPVRAVSDSFDVVVDWNEYTKTVSLLTN